jgi:E3 ubiquitin-protein ligase SIAH1
MASVTYIDDSGSEVIDPPKTEVLDVTELAGDPVPHSPKPNVVVSSSVRELLECPVCLSAMYPPIHQVHIYHLLNLFCT